MPVARHDVAAELEAAPALRPLRLRPLPVVGVAAAFPPLPVVAVAVAAAVLPPRPGFAAAAVAVVRLRPLPVVVAAVVQAAVVQAAELRPARLRLPASRATCGHTWRTLRCDLSYPKLLL